MGCLQWSGHTALCPLTQEEINYIRLDPELPPLGFAHEGDGAVDLHCRQPVVLEPGERTSVPTGIIVAIPSGYAGLVLPRSGNARDLGVGCVNAPGLIDSGYRGEIQVLLINHGAETVKFERGDRIAQLAVVPMPEVTWGEVEELDDTSRGARGFGSTGT